MRIIIIHKQQRMGWGAKKWNTQWRNIEKNKKQHTKQYRATSVHQLFPSVHFFAHHQMKFYAVAVDVGMVECFLPFARFTHISTMHVRSEHTLHIHVRYFSNSFLPLRNWLPFTFPSYNMLCIQTNRTPHQLLTHFEWTYLNNRNVEATFISNSRSILLIGFR